MDEMLTLLKKPRIDHSLSATQTAAVAGSAVSSTPIATIWREDSELVDLVSLLSEDPQLIYSKHSSTYPAPRSEMDLGQQMPVQILGVHQTRPLADTVAASEAAKRALRAATVRAAGTTCSALRAEPEQCR